MDYNALAQLLFPQVTETPETLEQRYPPRDVPAGAVVTRMAPSPTGFVHLGNLVHGLVSDRWPTSPGGRSVPPGGRYRRQAGGSRAPWRS